MSSAIDALIDTLNEDKSVLKILLYTIPVYFTIYMFTLGKIDTFIYLFCVTSILFSGLFTLGVNNIRNSNRETLSLKIVLLIKTILKLIVVIIPQIIVLSGIGFLFSKIKIPFNFPHIDLILSIIIWAVLFSFVFTSALLFSKNLRILDGYNFRAISNSLVEILTGFLFFIPQILFADFVIIAPIACLFYLINIPFTNCAFIAYISAVFVINISIMSNYFAKIKI